MNIWHDIDEDRISPENFISVIEITKGSKNKYELDKKTGMLILDRVLSTSTHYPANYGFIPRTFTDDDDPLDVLVLSSESIAPLTLVECKAIGILKMIDSGKIDEKIIAVCKTDPFYNNYNEITELPKHIWDELKHFYAIYKALENKDTVVEEILGSEQAKNTIKNAIICYKQKFCDNFVNSI